MAKILVIDDDEFQRKLLKSVLSSEGHVVVTYDRGVGATNFIMMEKPDLVLLDVNMPFLDGEQLAAMFAENPNVRGVQIALYTGEVSARTQGMVDAGLASALVEKGPMDAVVAQIAAILDKQAGAA